MPRRSPLPPELLLAPFNVRYAASLGIGRGPLRRRELAAPFRGVRTAAFDLDLIELCRTYAERMPQGHYFSDVTAARLWGIPLPTATDDRLHVTAPHPRREPRMQGVVGHRVAADADVRLLGDLPVSSPSDTWCRLGTVLRHDDLIAAGDRLLGWPQPLATLEEVHDALRRFGRRRGSRALHAARRELRPGSGSPRETSLRLAATRAGFPEPECNGKIQLSDDSETWGDLVYREWRVVFEWDGEDHRLVARRYRRDVERLNALALDGWVVVRVNKFTETSAALGWLDRAMRTRGWAPDATLGGGWPAGSDEAPLKD